MQINTKTNGEEFGGVSVGRFLFSERKKKGLSLTDLSERIRVRREFLEAIEKEEWQRLPPPAYVKGFLLSYAKALGIDEKHLIELYEISDTRPAIIKPLTRNTGSSKGFYILVIVISLFAFLVFFLFIKGHLSMPSFLMEQFFQKNKPPVLNSPTQTPTEQPSRDDKHSGAPHLTGPSEAHQPEAPASADSPTAGVAKISPAKTEEGALLLKVKAKKRTWIRVLSDSGEPKEQLMAPGSEMDFRAKEYFELLIGNAGGIALELNGEKMDNLGAQGEVVRLRLPEQFKRER